MGDLLIVSSKIKALAKKQGMNTASDFLPAFDKYVTEKVIRFCNVSKAYGKKTLSRQALGQKK